MPEKKNDFYFCLFGFFFLSKKNNLYLNSFVTLSELLGIINHSKKVKQKKTQKRNKETLSFIPKFL